jgi:hypothetical protein
MIPMEQTTPPAQKAGCMVRTFIIVLPLGLSFMVPLSLWIYYQKKHQPAPATSQYAAMLRKDLDAEDFTRYARILSQDIGERSLANPDHLDAASSFIESTMGYDNMGYAVERQGFESQGKSLVNLVAELPGKSKPNEVVLVCASYDEADASGVSALMCVAHALAGSTHARTIRFAAVVEAAGGFAILKEKRSAGSSNLKNIIRIGGPASTSDRSADSAPVQAFPITTFEQPGQALERLQELQRLIEQTADAP